MVYRSIKNSMQVLNLRFRASHCVLQSARVIDGSNLDHYERQACRFDLLPCCATMISLISGLIWWVYGDIRKFG